MKKLFMASIALVAFSASIILFNMTSCKKSNAQNCPTPTYPILGLWEGTYQTNQVSHAPTYISFTIYTDGTFIERSQIVNSTEFGLSKGTWKLNGANFTYTDTTLAYSGGTVVENGKLTFSNTGVLSNGTWSDVSGQPYSGTFQNIKRIN